MGMNELIGKNVVIELKNGNKYFGSLTGVDDCGGGLIFISIIDKFGKTQVFASGELVRVEED